MQYRRLGKTEEKVSALGFGCMRLPILNNDATQIDEERAIAMLRHAIDEGINYIDTAYPYHGKSGKAGSSEPLVAKALKDGYREKVKIATKLPSWLIETREDMDKYLHEQLKRLETDSIDFYLIHNLNKKNWKNVTELGLFDFMDKALKSGKVKHIGFSYHDNPRLFKEIVDAYDWSFCQIQYNYLDEEYQAGLEGLEYAAAKDIGIIIMEPLRGGSLTNNLPDEIKTKFKNLNPSRTPADIGLRWIWNRADVAVILSGMTEMQHVTENIATANDSLIDSMTEKELEAVKYAKKVMKAKLKVNCTTCAYCMPCPVGINIPNCFTHYNNAYLFDMNKAKRAYNHFMNPKQKASNCIACGKCEKHCPQNIPIINELKNVKKLFEIE